MTLLSQPFGFVLTGVLVAACGPSTPRLSSPEPAGGADYEIYNPTHCEAVAWTIDATGRIRHNIARISSGERTVLRVPALPQGSTVQAQALSPDGSECEGPHDRVVVRRLES